VNYFGFAEQVLKPHIKDYITGAIANNQRIWMTHFTSTTHHAWKTPDWFNTTDYMPTGLLSMGHQYFNRYLNTIRFHDAWMGELMQLLEDTGITNETLVVFAGDHGMAFHEDDGQEGTYGNAHISNLRVPITFRHPHLPSVQYHANATTISTLPTILDLLIHSGSLNTEDTAIASDLVHEYEGQSLLRPYKTSEDGRRAWNFAVINSGGKMLAVTSADAPWLLVIPFGKVFPYRFADISSDPLELDPIVSWTIEDVMQSAGDRFGAEAATWAQEAELVGKWWSTERKRLWKYHSGRPQW
jgi:arylsulfatase A-like enzyme